ncbi:MAG: hypothetical protein IT382_18635 [Deltaproteobacteria bacterium]|nr:hypothetical protein [Deltaproteobacteria bacterium]
MRAGCAAVVGFGSRLQALQLTAAPTVSDGQLASRNPYQTVLVEACPGTFLAAGGEGATFYRITPGATCDVYLAESAVPLGPARPRLDIMAGAVVGNDVWLGEEQTLWRLPPPCP